jgi:hypothetical protein
MGRYYDDAALASELRRGYSVYDRLVDLGIDIAEWRRHERLEPGQMIAPIVFTEAGLVYLSGATGGAALDNETDDAIVAAQASATAVADRHIGRLHSALVSGDEMADLNDVLYTVKVLGMVVSPSNDRFLSAPQVVNAYSERWHSVFGGPAGFYAVNGFDPGGIGGLHARSAIAGFDGTFALECEVIVAIPMALAQVIICRRGWLYPLPVGVADRLEREGSST